MTDKNCTKCIRFPPNKKTPRVCISENTPFVPTTSQEGEISTDRIRVKKICKEQEKKEKKKIDKGKGKSKLTKVISFPRWRGMVWFSDENTDSCKTLYKWMIKGISKVGVECAACLNSSSSDSELSSSASWTFTRLLM